VETSAQAPPALQRALHRAIAKVGDDFENLRYNTAIAALMTLLNDIRRLGSPDRDTVEKLIVLLAPLAPHFAEEVWEGLGHSTSVFEAQWPAYDPAMLVEDTVEIAVQVNGKVRGRAVVARDAGEADLLNAALADEGVQAAIAGKEIRRKVVVPGRLVNLVIG
jgi:leucyl-tRNA synthetase